MKSAFTFALAAAMITAMASFADAQLNTGGSALSGGTQDIGGSFGSTSFVGGGQSADATAQGILDQATSTSSSAFSSNGSGGSIFGGGASTGAGNANNFNSLGALGALGFGGRGGLGNRNSSQQFNSNTTGAASSPVRIPIRLGSELRALQAAAPSRITALEKRLTKLPGLEKSGSVSVVLAHRVAILTGVVATERDRDLIGRLAMLEPGVSHVQNDLTIRNAAAPQTLPVP